MLIPWRLFHQNLMWHRCVSINIKVLLKYLRNNYHFPVYVILSHRVAKIPRSLFACKQLTSLFSYVAKHLSISGWVYVYCNEMWHMPIMLVARTIFMNSFLLYYQNLWTKVKQKSMQICINHAPSCKKPFLAYIFVKRIICKKGHGCCTYPPTITIIREIQVNISTRLQY